MLRGADVHERHEADTTVHVLTCEIQAQLLQINRVQDSIKTSLAAEGLLPGGPGTETGSYTRLERGQPLITLPRSATYDQTLALSSL